MTKQELKEQILEFIAGMIFFGVPMWAIFRELYKELALYGL